MKCLIGLPRLLWRKIELVTVPMLERLFEDYKNIAAFVHDKHLKHDRHALKNLETIDDDLDLEGVILVRLADENSKVADHYSLDMVPCLILFHEGRPYIYKGEISDENEAIKWFRKKLVSFD